MWYTGTRLAQAQPWIIPFQASSRPGPKSDSDTDEAPLRAEGEEDISFKVFITSDA